jgi:phosphatidate cytidylyltransferase
MLRRFVTAGILLSLLIAGLVLPQLQWVIVAAVAAGALACVAELVRMVSPKGVTIRRRIAGLAVLLLVAEGAFTRLEHSVYVLGVMACAAFVYRMRGPVEGAFRDVMGTIGVTVYVGLPFATWAALFMAGGPVIKWIALALAVIFLTDSCALFSGKLFGKHRLIPKISPGKTWEGSIGGIVGAMTGTMIARVVWHDTWATTPILEMLLFALVFSLVTQLGDLSESLIKRDVGVKDSGGQLTGHGGWLDMLDAVVFSGIPLAVYLRVLHPELILS